MCYFGETYLAFSELSQMSGMQECFSILIQSALILMLGHAPLYLIQKQPRSVYYETEPDL